MSVSRHRTLGRKLGRDLRRRWAPAAAIAAAVLLGVGLFVGSYDSFRNLSASYEQTYSRLHFADVTATGGDPGALARVAREAPGVGRVSARTQADVPLSVAGTELVGRVTGLPEDPAAGVNTVATVSGRMPEPSHAREVVVEHHTAETFGVGAGDRMRVFDGRAWREVTITGVVRSPEYLWPARSRQEVLADPHSFAIVFAPQANAARLTGRPGADQVAIEMRPGASASEVDTVVDRLRAAGAVDVTTRAQQPSNAALHEDLAGFSEIAVGFPLLFLTAAGIAQYVLLTRLVRAERPVIGTLLAMGAHRRHLLRHYLSYGVAVAGAGAVGGVVLGTALTAMITGAYTGAIGIPDTVVAHRISTAMLGVLLGLTAGAIAATAPALSAMRVAPARAMRGDGGRPARPGVVARSFARWTRIPVVARMALRSMTRDPRRTLVTMTGTVLSLVLILASVGMASSMRSALDIQFGEVTTEDADIVTVPGAADLSDRLAAISGVAAVERALTSPITLGAHGHSYATTLTGLRPDTGMHGFRTVAGAPGLPADGVVAGAALAEQLDVRVGDTVTAISPFGEPRDTRLSALVDEPLGTAVYATAATARTLAPDASSGYLLRFTDGADRDAIRAAVTGLPEVLAYSDTAAIRSQFDRFLALFAVFNGTMLVLGAALAFTVIYVTMTVNLAERTVELTTLRAAGAPIHRLTAALALENLVATVCAIPIGLGAGGVVAWAALRSFDSDMFTLRSSIDPVSMVLAVAAVLVAAALSQLTAVRFLRRVDIARVVRERAV